MTKARELAKLGEVMTNSQIGGRRNLILNPKMAIAQRGTSTASVTTAGYYSCDRWNLTMSGRDEAVFTVSQNSSNILDGFSNSFKIETTTAESAIASDEFFIARQKIEAQNLQQLAYGTSSAEKITLSFYVKSSVTATFAIYLYKADTTARVIGSTYTINSANTWEKKTITFVGDTDSSATIANDNGDGLNVGFVLGAGSAFTGTSNTSWADYANGRLADGHAGNAVVTTTNATWEITGVQLEVGSQATPFEHRSFGEELLLCQRYFQDIAFTGTNLFTLNPLTGSANRVPMPPFAPPMRTAPTFVFRDVNNNTGFLSEFSSGTQTSITSLAGGTITGIGTGIGGGYLNLGRSLSNPISMCFKADAEL